MYEDMDLSGMCAIASAKLWNDLSSIGIKSEIHYGDSHVFLVLNGLIVDVTATQFKDGKFHPDEIFISPLKAAARIKVKIGKEKIRPWNTETIYSSVKELYEDLKDWPEEQSIPKEFIH